MKLTRMFFAATALATFPATFVIAQDEAATPTSDTTQATDTLLPAAVVASDRTMFSAPMTVHEGYTTVAIGEISTDSLEGAHLYGSDDKNIGNVDSLLFDADELTVAHIVFDVGGFLGMGTHKIALTLDEVQITQSGSGEVRIYINATKADLKGQPEFAG